MTSIGGDENNNDSNNANSDSNNNYSNDARKKNKNDLELSLTKNKEMMELHKAMTFLGQPHRRPIGDASTADDAVDANGDSKRIQKQQSQRRQQKQHRQQIQQPLQKQQRQKQYQKQQDQRGGIKQINNSNEDKKWNWLKRSSSTDFSGKSTPAGSDRTAVSDDAETFLSSSTHFGKIKDPLEDNPSDEVKKKEKEKASSRRKNTQQKLKKKMSCISDDSVVDTNSSNHSKNIDFLDDNDDEASYDSDDSDQGDPTTTAFIGGGSMSGGGDGCFRNSFLHASTSEGWEKADEYFIAEAHECTKRITRQLYYMGLECPFVDIDQVIPSFGNVHSHLGSLMPQHCTVKRECTDEDLLGLYEQEGNGNANSDAAPRRMSLENNARLFVTGFMYTKETDIFQGMTAGYTKPKMLEEPNSFSSAITGGIDGIVAKQLHLPPSPSAMLQDEEKPKMVANKNEFASNDNDRGPSTNGEKKGWLKRVFNRKVSKTSSDTSKGSNDNNQPPSLDSDHVYVSSGGDGR